MKKMLPLIFLFVVALGCSMPSDTNSSSSSQDKRKTTTHPTIEYSKPQWQNQDNSILWVRFEIKNTSNKDLRFVKVTATFHDKDGNYVNNESAFASRENLPAGARTPVEIMGSYDRRIKSATFHFDCQDSESIGDIDIDASEVAKL